MAAASGFSPFLGAAVKFVQAAARMQRYAQPVLALDHQPMETGGVDAGDRVARHDLTGRDVRCRIDCELQRDRQFGEVDVVAFEDDVFPCAPVDDLAGNVFLAAFAERRGQIPRFHPETGGQQLAIAGNVRDQLHVVAADVFEHDDRALPRLVELEHQRGRVEMQIDRLTNAQQFVRMFSFHQSQETAQALLVAVDVPQHAVPLMSLDDGTFAASKRQQ